MLHDFYQNLPLHVDPIAFTIGSFSIRWYALSYIIGFAVVYFVLLWKIKHDDLKETVQISNFQFPISNKISISKIKNQVPDLFFDFLLMAFFAAIVGGRLGYALFYDLQYYLTNPLAIISPYDQSGNMVGLYGMSYHGAVVGVLAGSLVFLKLKKINFLAWADFIIPAVPLGYFFGRMGNFLNGELYGRMTDSRWGMYFGSDPNRLRHPSQIYEALLEGLLLFVILWNLRKKKFKNGTLLAIYLMGYAMFRIIGEQFRQPDRQIGLLMKYFTMGQLLSLPMLIGGLFLLVSINRKK